MDFWGVREVLAFSLLSLPEETFYLLTVWCLFHFYFSLSHFGALKSDTVLSSQEVCYWAYLNKSFCDIVRLPAVVQFQGAI